MNENGHDPSMASRVTPNPAIEASLAEFQAKRAVIDKRGEFYAAIADGEGGKDATPTDDRSRAAFLFDLLDDIDTLGDIAKSDDAGYRAAVEKIQKRRWQSGIVTDGYGLFFPGDIGYAEAAYPTGTPQCKS